MNIEHINTQYEQMVYVSALPHTSVFTSITFYGFFILLLSICCLKTMADLMDTRTKGKHLSASDLKLIIQLYVVGSLFISFTGAWGASSIMAFTTDYLRLYEQAENRQQQLVHWKQEYAEPYLQKLPESNYHVLQIENQGPALPDQSFPLQIIYEKDGRAVSDNDHYTVLIDLPAGSKPLLTTVHLDHGLGPVQASPDKGFEYEPGEYHKALHLPSGYTFKSNAE
ncbi:hypothetical protein [Paenibacillus bovis]|uniref:Uncharacterized protein n=1 Tax=Paenibacillus bovis TaxID=1616788 RepID=A0A1X9T490_9BACL|nr:hypothetical protein [Paenibacillus bovis]ARR10679.1 hypothetical protein AR543_p0071 [Paenibacillus bovis]